MTDPAQGESHPWFMLSKELVSAGTRGGDPGEVNQHGMCEMADGDYFCPGFMGICFSDNGL